MFAIFETGGKQYKVQQGDTIYVEKLDVADGKEVKFENILMVDNKFGQPYVKGASVVAVVEKHGRNKKIRIIKFKSKKHYYKRQGHRQPYTKLIIKSINA
ncbi:MAG: 50S ribosomal protein L21 [Candidatus Ureaplasma intestinipullorum]|uniref:Large ribosomal subunit protein bL21 n=1 Tax=Candidatus Ureaplasma intestinipullorum TaxID=2838770 RepID=A0A9E2KV91_9BACT|nr:50S ribosomal protein L21 [Candidatus Ureaplasma intestinipullorum]